MKNITELKEFAKTKINNEYTIIDFVEINKEDGLEMKGLLVHEDVDGETYTSIGYYDSERRGTENFGRIASIRELEYNGQLWDNDNEDVISGIEIINVINCDYDTYWNYINNDWSDSLIKAAQGREIEL